MTTAPRMITLHPKDNVAIALAEVSAGETIDSTDVKTQQSIKQGHKIAIAPIAAGQNVIRYGQTIGQATADIAAGDHVHVHNLGMGEHSRDYAHATEAATPITATTGAVSAGAARLILREDQNQNH